MTKWKSMYYNVREESKELITHKKEGKDASRWWDVQLEMGGCIANISILDLKDTNRVIWRSN